MVSQDTIAGIVHNRLIGLDEGVAHPQFERAAAAASNSAGHSGGMWASLSVALDIFVLILHGWANIR